MEEYSDSIGRRRKDNDTLIDAGHLATVRFKEPLYTAPRKYS